MDNNSVASTSRGDPRAEPELATKKPRPKPRKKVLTGLIDTAPSAPPSDLAPITTPVPKSVSAVALPETTIPTKPQPQGIPLTIADRAKSRLRNARAKPAAQDIIDIPSDDDDDERLLKLSPHRPMQQDVRRINTNPVPNQLPPPFHPSQESLVAPTSDFQLAPVVSSQLPPSDPPSTLPLVASTPDSAKKRKEVTEAGNVDESLLNSPKRRKGQHLVTDNKKDQRHISPPRAIAAGDPPPNFFASSSSSLPQPPAPLIQRKTRKKPAEKIQPPDNAPEAVDPDPPRKKGRPNPKKKSTPKTTSVSFASTSRPKPDSKDPVYKSMEVVEDSDQEAEFPTLPPPPLLKSHSPLSGLSESNSFRTSKPITPNRRRLLPEVVITTVPRKRSSPAEERRVIDKDGSPKGKKRQKKATDDHFDGLDDEVSKKGSKGKGKAPAKRKRGTKPQPKEATGDRVLEEDPVDNPVGTSKTKSARSRKSRIVDSDDEVEEGAAGKDSEVTYKTPQEVMDKTPSQDTREDQENALGPLTPLKPTSNPTVTPSSVSRTPFPTSATSFARLNYGHSLANEEKPMTMAEIIKKANSATGTPTAIRSHSKGSRSALRKIAPLHSRRKTPPPLPPKPPPPKKTKKQLDLEEKWEEELEETIEGWAALSSQERELLRKQKRDMEMGYED